MAGHKTWGVGEDVVQTEFQGYVADQIVAQFASTAARDAGWLSPPNGAFCVTTDTNTKWQRVSGAWVNADRGLPKLQNLAGFAGGFTLNDPVMLYAGTAVVTTNTNADISVTYGTAFPHATIAVVVTAGDALTDQTTLWVPHTYSNSAFQARAIECSSGGARISFGPVRLNYIALGA